MGTPSALIATEENGRTTSKAVANKSIRRWTLGSILFLSSFAAVMGPWQYVAHLASTPRLPFTAAYFGSLGLTIYFSMGVSRPPRYFASLYALLSPPLAAQHHPHPILGPLPTGLPDLVSCELLPDGLHRAADGHYVWLPQSYGLDAGVRVSSSKPGSPAGGITARVVKQQSLALSSQGLARGWKMPCALAVGAGDVPMERDMREECTDIISQDNPQTNPSIWQILCELDTHPSMFISRRTLAFCLALSCVLFHRVKSEATSVPECRYGKFPVGRQTSL